MSALKKSPKVIDEFFGAEMQFEISITCITFGLGGDTPMTHQDRKKAENDRNEPKLVRPDVNAQAPVFVLVVE